MDRKEYKKQYQRRWQAAHRHPCPDCGKPITRHRQRCRSCASKNAWRLGKITSTLCQKGELNFNWKGGKAKCRDYILIRKPDHPRANKSNGYIFEHIVVWEEAHNQPLPDGWVIHHLNGIKADNRPKNLLGMPRRGHSPGLTVKEVQKRLRELEAELAQQRLC